ncbi:MAG: DUF433 domain-containing protein [Thermomicrobiales bacterium]
MLTIPNIEQVVVRDDDILDGMPVFVGTRVPVQTLLDYLEAGQPLDEFLDDFPTVRREQATQLLEILKQALLSIPR